MALVLKDRVQETTTTTGTGTVTLDGAVSGFQSFSAIGNGNTCYYAIVGGTEWEVGLGTYTSSGTTLSRDTILESSNGGTAVNFSAGTKNVFVTYPAEKSIYQNASGVANLTSTDVTTALGYTPVTDARTITINGTSYDLTANRTWSVGTVTSITAGTGLSGGTITSSGTIAIDSTVATLTGSQTLINKDISGSTNTLSNIGNSSLTNSSITINGTSTSLGGSISVGTVTSVTATSPVTSTGGNTPVIAMPAATGSVNGYLTSTDWTTFNSKGNGTVTSVAELTLGTTGTDLSSTVANGTTTPVITLNVPTASATNRGVLSSADWTTFNNKGSGTVTTASVVSANGFAGTVANDTTTPAITLTTSITGVLKGNGTAISAATAGTDFVAPSTATNFTATQTFTGSTSTLAAVFQNAAEVTTVSATAATGTINYDVTTQSVLYYTSNASANWTVNFRGSSGTSLDTLMSTGQTITVAFLVTQGATAYYNNAVQIDGSSVTPKYQGGTAPTSGNTSSIDIYQYTIVKTGSGAFTVFASQTKYA